MKLRVNLFNNTVGTAPSWDSTNTLTIGSIFANLTDWDTSIASGVNLSIVDAAPTGKNSSGGLVTGSPHGIEQSVWANYFTYTSGTTSKFLFQEINAGDSDWTIGETVFVRFAALNTSNRDLTLTAAGGGSGTYDNSVFTPPTASPPTPVVFSTVVQDDGTGKARILLSVAVSTLVTNLQFIEIFNAKINSIGDGIVRIGEAQTWSVTGFTPTSATIDGIALTGVSGSGFTMPDYDDLAIPDYGLRVVSATDGVITATFNVYVEPKTGYHYTRIEDVSNTGDGYLQTHYPDLAVGWTVTLLNGDQFDPPVAVNNIGADGEIITDHEGIQQLYVWKLTDRSVVPFDLDTTGEVFAPVMPGDTSASVDEGTTTLGTYAASSGTPPITYTLGGADAALFDINSSSAEVTFKVAATIGTGSISVTATNAAGSDSQNISYTVNEVAVAPVMPGDTSATVLEGTLTLGTYAASSGTAPITYTLGGTDAALFNINSSTAAVTFKVAAVPGTGSIIVTATNSAGSDSQTISYEVEADEALISSVATTRIGGSSAVTVSGFGSSINAGTLDGVALTAASNTSITVKGLINNQTVPRPGSRTLTLTDGISDASTDVPVNAPEGWAHYVVTVDFVEAINGVSSSYLPVTETAGDFILYPLSPSTGKSTVVSDVGVVTNNVGTQQMFIVNNTTKVARSFNVTTTAGAGSIGSGGTDSEVMGMDIIRMVAL